MCIFFGDEPVEQVTSTRIFARSAPASMQYLVYAMSLERPAETAMVLPLPSAENTADCEFLSLADYPEFFADLDTCVYGHS